jgi:5-methylcytosine-specific restriction endonuclease McrA
LWLSCESALRVNFRHPTPSLAWEALFPPDYKTMPYDQYLQTAHWQATRQGALTRAKFACQICNAKERLHVHHRTYARRGEELPEDLTVLCADCHGLFHERRQVVKVAANGKPAAVKAVVKR